jgi:hypothetical protein
VRLPLQLLLILEVRVLVVLLTQEERGLLLAGARRRHRFEIGVSVNVFLNSVFAHSTDMSSAVFEYVCTCVAVGTVWNALMLSSGICDLWEEALVGAQTEVLV